MIFGRESFIHNLQMFKEKLSRIALIVVCRLFSANKNVCYRLSQLMSEELAESCNGRKVRSESQSGIWLILINPATLHQFAQLRIRQIFCAKFLLGGLFSPRRTVFF